MKRAPFKCMPMERTGGGASTIGVQVSTNSQDAVISIEAVTGMMINYMRTIPAQKAAADFKVTVKITDTAVGPVVVPQLIK